MSTPSFFKYLRKAFWYHWNLLAVISGTAAAVISGRADIFLPILAAAEIVYLAMVSASSRFQNFVNAEECQTSQPDAPSHSDKHIQEILLSLNKADRQHFKELRDLSLRLRTLSRGVKGETHGDSSGLSDMQMQGINRLLWIYLKLLYSKNALETFFHTTNAAEIEETIRQTQQRLEALGPETENDPIQAKRRKSLLDTLATCQQRIDNYHTVRKNYEFIKDELGRLYSKIASIVEMGIGHQDADIIGIEIDTVSASVQHTEKAMRDLEAITGRSLQDEEPPSLLEQLTE